MNKLPGSSNTKKVEKKIKKAELFLKRLKAMRVGEVASQYQQLYEHYLNLEVKLNRFEEIIQAREREKYFI